MIYSGDPLRSLTLTQQRSGLWVPQPLRFARRCCCTCTCGNCSENEPPCCLGVHISDMAEDSCAADECHCLNRFFLVSRTGKCTWSRTITGFFCGTLTITVLLYLDGSNYKLQTTLSSASDTHIWREDLGTSKPNCSLWDEENLTHISSSGDCDSSSATCSITSRDESTAECTQSWRPCAACDCGEGPEEWEVVISGMVERASPICGSCNSLNNTYILTWLKSHPPTPSCTWSYDFPGAICGVVDIELLVYASVPNYRIRVQMNTATPFGICFWDLDTGSSNRPECNGVLNLSLPWQQGWPAGQGCQANVSSCIISAA